MNLLADNLGRSLLARPATAGRTVPTVAGLSDLVAGVG